MEILTQKYRRDPNAKVQSAYLGVAHGNRTVTRVTALNKDADRLESTRAYGIGIPRGQGGRVATLVLGGMECTLDEIEYIIEGVKEKKFTPQRKPQDIVKMCHMVIERRNERIKYLRKNPSEAPKPKHGPVLHLPVGLRMAPAGIPGARVLAEV